MFLSNIVKLIWNWGFNNSELQESIKALEKFDEEAELAEYDSRAPLPAENVPNNNECFERSGVVKFVTETYGLTDKDLYFEYPKINEIKVGMIINYLAVMKDGEQKIVRILSFETGGEWSEEINKECHPVSLRTFPGQVKERRGRIVVVSLETEDYHCNLDKINSEFIPVVGDWVHLDANVEVDEKSSNLAGRILDVLKISPIRVKHGCNGVITEYNKELGMGIINKDIRFSLDNCAPGFSPMFKDSVSYEIIESTMNGCTWRALKVSQNKPFINASVLTNPDDSSLLELLADKNDITLSNKNVISLKNIGDRLNITLEVVNNGSKSSKILGCTFKSSDSQLSVQKPSLNQPVEILPKETIIIILHCVAKRMGVTKELFIVNFDGFQIGRWIFIHVIPFTEEGTFTNRRYDHMHKKKRTAAQNHMLQLENHNYLPGSRVVKSPAFIQNKLKMYDIPPELTHRYFEFLKDRNHSTQIPPEIISKSIVENLNFQNYQDRFHSLLFMEELSVVMSLRDFDIPRTNFIRNDEYLMLEVENLSERRPSVLIGDRVFAFNPNDPNSERKEGYVHKIGAKHLFLKFASSFHSTYNGEDYSIEFNVNRSSYRKFHHSIETAVRNLGKAFLFPTSVQKQVRQVDFICPEEEKDSVELLITPKQSKYVRFSKSPKNQTDETPDNKNKESKYIRFTQKSPKNNTTNNIIAKTENGNMPRKLKLEWYDKSLNKYQKAAVKNILYGESRPLPYLIFGPPGTGKTVTLIETILQILRMIPHSRILVSAPSNSAADLIALRLLDSGVLAPGDLVRLVAYRVVTEGNIPEKLLPYSVTADISKEGTFTTKMGIQNGVTLRAPISYLGRHRITVTTCVSASTLHIMGFPKDHFTHIIVDEAAHSTEPEIMVPLIMFDIKSAQIVLAGDPLQLGPYLNSSFARQHGLEVSFFERIMERFPYTRDLIGFPDTYGYDPSLITKLIYNYRSLPKLLHLTNELFYHSDLIPTVSEEAGLEVDILKSLKDILPVPEGQEMPIPFVFHGVQGDTLQTNDSPSWYNPAEAGQVFFYVCDLYRKGLTAKDIGIVSPYLRQCQHIKSLFTDALMDYPKIGSVEEFQGQEFKVILLSTVRSSSASNNYRHELSLRFISYPRRLNVALSRAKAVLIIVGDPRLLIQDKCWRTVILYAMEIGGYVGCHFSNFY